MSETATVVVQEIKALKTGQNSKGSWALNGLIDNNDEIVGTWFNDDVATVDVTPGSTVEVEREKTDRGYTIKSISAAQTNGDTPAVGTRAQMAPTDQAQTNRRAAMAHAATLFAHTIPTTATAAEAVGRVGPLVQALEQYLNSGTWPNPNDIPF